MEDVSVPQMIIGLITRANVKSFNTVEMGTIMQVIIPAYPVVIFANHVMQLQDIVTHAIPQRLR